MITNDPLFSLEARWSTSAVTQLDKTERLTNDRPLEETTAKYLRYTSQSTLLTSVLDSIIDESQSGFIQNILIYNNIIRFNLFLKDFSEDLESLEESLHFISALKNFGFGKFLCRVVQTYTTGNRYAY